MYFWPGWAKMRPRCELPGLTGARCCGLAPPKPQGLFLEERNHCNSGINIDEAPTPCPRPHGPKVVQ